MKHLKRLCLICGALFLFAIPFSACTEESEDTDLDSSLNNDLESDSKSYEGTGVDRLFSFSFQIDQTEFSYAEGIKGTLKAYVTNVSGETYTMSKTRYFQPVAYIYNHENSECILQLTTVETDEDLSMYAGETLEIADGQQGWKVFWFSIHPTKTIVGNYDVEICFRDYYNGGEKYSVIFENVITVTE